MPKTSTTKARVKFSIMTSEDDEKFLESFKRKHNQPAPKWAFQSDDIVKEMDSVPLFMSARPDEPNEHLEALQALLYDGTPDEIATNFKNNGNESITRGDVQGFRDAIVHYTKGLEVGPDDSHLKAVLLCNRALANLKLQNYGSACKDARQALDLSPEMVKARFRLTRALLHLEKYEEAVQEYELLPSAERTDLEELMNRKRQVYSDPRIKALAARNLQYVPGIEQPITLQLQGIQEIPTYHFSDKFQKHLVFPVILFYPQFAQFDLIEKFNEDDKIGDQLSHVLREPAPWDSQHQLKVQNVELYFVDQSDPQILHKIDSKRTLKSYFGSAITKIDLGLLSLLIVTKKDNQDFISKFSKIIN